MKNKTNYLPLMMDEIKKVGKEEIMDGELNNLTYDELEVLK